MAQTKKTNLPKVGTPIEDRVVVKQDIADEYTDGGIIIPETAQELPQRGIVVAVGARTDGKPMQVQPGDRILYGKYAGILVKIKGQDYLIMRQADILIKNP